MQLRSSFLLPIFTSVLFLIPVPEVEAQERSPLQLLFGAKKEGSSSRSLKAKKSTRFSLFGGGPKRVEINLTEQRLRAYEGNRVVFRTNISSGKGRGTPTGNFKAGPYKSATHFSSLYYNAPMPWSTQISGNIFVHGSDHVPNYPASHGCIRVPVTGSNPAKRLYKWLDVGTPIKISY